MLLRGGPLSPHPHPQSQCPDSCLYQFVFRVLGLPTVSQSPFSSLWFVLFLRNELLTFQDSDFFYHPGSRHPQLILVTLGSRHRGRLDFSLAVWQLLQVFLGRIREPEASAGTVPRCDVACVGQHLPKRAPLWSFDLAPLPIQPARLQFTSQDSTRKL